MKFLVRRAMRGDPEAFIGLMEENKRMLYKVAKGYLRDEEDIADAMQETMLAAFEHIGEMGQPVKIRIGSTALQEGGHAMNLRDMEMTLKQELELSPGVDEKIKETYRIIRKSAVTAGGKAEGQQDRKLNGRHGKRYRRSALIPVAAAAVLVCSMAAAAELPIVQEWISRLGVNQKIVEEMNEINPDIIYEDTDPVLTVQEIYMDGTNLVFTAAADDTVDYILGIKDHIFINGVDCLNMGFEETESGSRIYRCTVTPYEPEADSEGKAIPDTGVPQDENAFTVSLTE